MKFNITYNNDMDINLINIITHQTNKNYIENVIKRLDEKITLIDIKSDKTFPTSISEIESIRSFTNLSKVRLCNQNEYYVKGRLKELPYLNQYNITRINNSELLNLNQIKNFTTDNGSRIIIETYSGRIYKVSRYYAKEIKEMIL